MKRKDLETIKSVWGILTSPEGYEKEKRELKAVINRYLKAKQQCRPGRTERRVER